MPVRPQRWLSFMVAAAMLVSGHSLAQSAPNRDITLDTIARLSLRLALPLSPAAGLTGAPAVAGDRLFVVTAFPHTVLAIDLTRPDAPVLWRKNPAADDNARGLATRNVSSGGITLAAGRLFLSTFDGHALRLDPSTGDTVWDVTLADVSQGETLRAPPLVAGDRVVIGNDGSDFGVRGWIAALDAASGQVLWKHSNTGPDTDVGIGTGFPARYLSGPAADRGVTSWPPDAWQQGGGGLADPAVFDPAAGLLFYATGNAAPWNAEQRVGDNYFTAGLFARDATTGAARWFVPINPHDLYGFGAAGALIPAELPRPVLIHSDANGMVYVIDRSSGEILSASPFVSVNATDGVDLHTGTLHRNPGKATRVNATTRDICPGWPGATGGTAQAAFSPRTGLLYIPASQLCMDMEARQTSFMTGTTYVGANLRLKAPRDAPAGALVGWDVRAAKVAWTIDEPLPLAGGVLATTGGIVVYGTLDGWLKAVDAASGKPLWQHRATPAVTGQPVDVRGSDGREYIAVLAGLGGPAAATAEDEIDIRDATGAHGYANARRVPPASRGADGMLYVFGLP